MCLFVCSTPSSLLLSCGLKVVWVDTSRANRRRRRRESSNTPKPPRQTDRQAGRHRESNCVGRRSSPGVARAECQPASGRRGSETADCLSRTSIRFSASLDNLILIVQRSARWLWWWSWWLLLSSDHFNCLSAFVRHSHHYAEYSKLRGHPNGSLELIAGRPPNGWPFSELEIHNTKNTNDNEKKTKQIPTAKTHTHRQEELSKANKSF